MNYENHKESPSLRSQAEQQLANLGVVPQAFDVMDPRALVHELQVHQIELEMQNEELRNAQHQLEEESQRYQNFYEFTPVGYLTLDEKGTIKEMNLTAATMIGRERSFLVKQPFAQFLSPDSSSVFEQFYRRIFSGTNRENCEVMIDAGHNGQTCMLVEGIADVKEDGRLQECRVVLSDITDIKQAGETLSRYEFLAQNSRDIVLFVRRDDSRILEVNAAAVNSYGYNYEELLGMTVKDLRAPEFLETADTQMAEADAHGSLFETVHRRKDGSTFPVEVSSQGATINGTRTLISVIRDITERKRADDVLRESRQHNEFLANILELSSQPFAVRYPDGLLGLFNEAFEQLTGYTGNELKAIDKAEILTPPEWREIDREKLKELRRTGRPVTYEKEYIRKDNSRVPVQMFAHFVTNPDGMEYYYAFITDITERKQAEKLIQQHLEELRSANEDMALFNDAAVGRELRMIELKREINKLCAKAGLPQRYEVDINEDQP